jgi:hypothetical protein
MEREAPPTSGPVEEQRDATQKRAQFAPVEATVSATAMEEPGSVDQELERSRVAQVFERHLSTAGA